MKRAVAAFALALALLAVSTKAGDVEIRYGDESDLRGTKTVLVEPGGSLDDFKSAREALEKYVPLLKVVTSEKDADLILIFEWKRGARGGWGGGELKGTASAAKILRDENALVIVWQDSDYSRYGRSRAIIEKLVEAFARVYDKAQTTTTARRPLEPQDYGAEIGSASELKGVRSVCFKPYRPLPGTEAEYAKLQTKFDHDLQVLFDQTLGLATLKVVPCGEEDVILVLESSKRDEPPDGLVVYRRQGGDCTINNSRPCARQLFSQSGDLALAMRSFVAEYARANDISVIDSGGSSPPN